MNKYGAKRTKLTVSQWITRTDSHGTLWHGDRIARLEYDSKGMQIGEPVFVEPTKWLGVVSKDVVGKWLAE